MPLYHVAPTRQLPHTIDLIQRQSAPRFANEIERDQQYPDPEVGALCVVNTNVQVYNGTGWIPVGGGQPTHINNLQDVDARFPPDGAVLTWSSAAQAWGWSMPATPEIGWCDNFERTSLGPDWTVGPVFEMGDFTVVVENALASGALVAGENDEPSPTAVMGSVRTTAAVPDDQSVEATVGNFFQGHDPSIPEGYQWVESDMWLFTQVVGGGSNACLGVYIIIQTNQGPSFTGGCYMQLITVDAAGVRTEFGDGTFSPLTGWQSNPDYTVRFETTAAGHAKAFFDGHLVIEGDLTPTGGNYVGAAQQWSRTNYASTVPNPGTSPRFEDVCVNMPAGTPAG